jgi:LCP family protein required for cell wall assembly
VLPSVEVETNGPTVNGRRRWPSLAAPLSFLWPGLGQLYFGYRRLAVLFAIPPLLLLPLLLYALRRGSFVLAVELFADRAAGLAAVAIVLVLGAWRLAAVAHAFVSSGPRESRRLRVLDRAVVLGLAAVILVSHVGLGYYLISLSNAGTQVFGGPNASLVDLSTPGIAEGSPGVESTPWATGTPTAPPSLNSRVTIFFSGVDSAPGRTGARYDSLMVVSYDPKTNSVQMVSIPRDSASFPLYFGGQVSVTTRINTLPSEVASGRIKSPDSPFMTLVKEVGYLVGIRIDYYAAMDFAGFVKMVDTVGGIDIVCTSDIADASYSWGDGKYGYYLAAGPHHVDGANALAYVRSRRGSSDWSRASRQQQVVIALLHRVAQPDQILNLPNLIATLASAVSTNFPASQVADYVDIGQNVPAKNIAQFVLGPPYSISGINYVNSAATWCLRNDRVAALSIYLFGKDSLWYHKRAPADTCHPLGSPSPTPPPTPGATPLPLPSEGPTATASPSPSASES